MRWLCMLLGVMLAAPVVAQERRPDPDALVALLRAARYAELDTRVGAYQSAYEASTDAEWHAAIAFAGFQRVDPDLAPALDAWVAARPNSYAARLARAAHFYQRGWSSRGGRFSDDTPGGRMEAMRGHLDRAQRDLQESLKLGKRAQLSHRYLIGIAMARGDAKAARTLHEDAVRSDPENYASRRAYLNTLRPEWGGSMAAMQALVDETAAQPATPKLRAVVQHLKASTLGRMALEAYRAKNYPRALELYAAGLAEAEDPILLANRALALRETGRQDEAMRDLNRSLELDPTSGEALERRGNLHEIRRQIVPAARDLEAAASYGRPYAMQRLGLLYINGKDVPKDYVKAAKWLKLGAEHGDDRAQSALGWMYSEGAGVPQDGRQAIALWRLAAAQGNAQARKYLDDLPWYWRVRGYFNI